MNPTQIRPAIETIGGVTLFIAPFWVDVLQTVNLILATAASVCGAIVAIYGVYSIIRRHGNNDKF